MADYVAEMDKAVRCLALEVPAAVHADVWRRWTDVVDGITALRADVEAAEQSMWGDMVVSSADLRTVLDHLPLTGRSIPDGAHDRLRWLLDTGKSKTRTGAIADPD